ncbi:MAG: aminotransferase class V-fold PLP-dependent enzyme [Bacteriovoracaceae bacterium]|nr:aminotransferase class V-fold PLP-dependent enzyme [Bacteriovoracaceae bacterium]
MFSKIKIPDHLRPSDPRFGSGPSLIPIKHLEALAQSGKEIMGTSHRKDAVKNVVKEIQEGMKTYFNLPAGYEVVLGNGGATMLWDMIGLGMVEKSSSHFTCGEFSEKWYKAHSLIPWIKTHQTKVEYGQGINPVEIDRHDFIACTLNETSTGVMLSEVPVLKNQQTIMSVDATSGAGQIGIDFSRVDMFYFSPQKVLASDGGLFICIMSPKAIERALRIGADKSRFIPESLKWSHAIENSRNHQTYNTPAIATLFLVNEQMKLLNKLGFSQVEKMALEKSKMVYQWAQGKEYLSAFIKEKQYRSTAVATIDVDEEFKVDDLTKMLWSQKIARDIDGYRKLGRNQLRISMFHNITLEDLEKLTQAISFAIENV